MPADPILTLAWLVLGHSSPTSSSRRAASSRRRPPGTRGCLGFGSRAGGRRVPGPVAVAFGVRAVVLLAIVVATSRSTAQGDATRRTRGGPGRVGRRHEGAVRPAGSGRAWTPSPPRSSRRSGRPSGGHLAGVGDLAERAAPDSRVGGGRRTRSRVAIRRSSTSRPACRRHGLAAHRQRPRRRDVRRDPRPAERAGGGDRRARRGRGTGSRDSDPVSAYDRRAAGTSGSGRWPGAS